MTPDLPFYMLMHGGMVCMACYQVQFATFALWALWANT